VDEHRLPEVAALPGSLCIYLPGSFTVLYGWQRIPIWFFPAPGTLAHSRSGSFRNRRTPAHRPGGIPRPKDLGPVLSNPFTTIKTRTTRTNNLKYSRFLKKQINQNIDSLLETTKPHVFHFIGHGRLMDENRQETGQVALADPVGQCGMGFSHYFSELFNRPPARAGGAAQL